MPVPLIVYPADTQARRAAQTQNWYHWGTRSVILLHRRDEVVLQVASAVPVDYAAYLWDGEID
jgi:hypothetical protein